MRKIWKGVIVWFIVARTLLLCRIAHFMNVFFAVFGHNQTWKYFLQTENNGCCTASLYNVLPGNGKVVEGFFWANFLILWKPFTCSIFRRAICWVYSPKSVFSKERRRTQAITNNDEVVAVILLSKQILNYQLFRSFLVFTSVQYFQNHIEHKIAFLNGTALFKLL